MGGRLHRPGVWSSSGHSQGDTFTDLSKTSILAIGQSEINILTIDKPEASVLQSKDQCNGSLLPYQSQSSILSSGHSGDPAGLRQARLYPGRVAGDPGDGGGPGLLQGDALPRHHGRGHQLGLLRGLRGLHGQDEGKVLSIAHTDGAIV